MIRTIACVTLCLLAAAPDDIVPPAAPPQKPPAAVPGDAPASAPPSAAPAAPVSLPPVNRRWLDKLDAIDRTALDGVLGYRMPAFPADGVWIGDAVATDSLKGKVVLIQSFSTATSSGKLAVSKTASAAKQAIADGDLVFMAVHTPNGAAGAEKALRKPAAPTLIDETGRFCDALGAFGTPVNVLIDRDGVVRYAGLNNIGLKAAIKELCAEQPKGIQPAPRPAPIAGTSLVNLPAPTDAVDTRFKQDRRGHPAPEFYVESWITAIPDPAGKVLVIDFWATWCAPCRQAIPHMSELQTHYRDSVCVVGVTSETKQAFDSGMNSQKLLPSAFSYALAADASGAMSGFYGVGGIPACVIVTSDGIVRWQGAPDGLTQSLLDPIVAANQEWYRAASANFARDRWRAALKNAPDRPLGR